MTSINKISTRFFTLIALLILNISLSAQSNHWFQKLIDEYDPENKMEVSVERAVGNNDAHPYMDLIAQKDDQFIKWLYFINIHNAEEPGSKNDKKIFVETLLGETNFETLSDWSLNIRDKKAHKAPIVFTIIEEGQMRYATINNIVVIEEKDNANENNDGYSDGGWDIFGIRKGIAKLRVKGMLKNQNIQGDLPKGSMSFIDISRNRMKCGVNVPTSSAYVKIDINDLDGNLIATLVDDELRKGWNNYKWVRGDYPKGKYQLSISVDDQTQTQNFKLK